MKKTIVRDPVAPQDFLYSNLIYSCEQCSFFEEDQQTCNLGFKTEPHLKQNQDRSYELTGRLSICRFQEID